MPQNQNENNSNDQLNNKQLQIKHEIKKYKELDVSSWSNTEIKQIDLDPLTFWGKKEIQTQFPYMSQVAPYVFAVPGGSHPSECAFSAAGNVLTPHRNDMSPTKFKQSCV